MEERGVQMDRHSASFYAVLPSLQSQGLLQGAAWKNGPVCVLICLPTSNRIIIKTEQAARLSPSRTSRKCGWNYQTISPSLTSLPTLSPPSSHPISQCAGA
mmetsp:Transcript_30999/g.61138  ORF Transcript_30999/g.61138 Transcript_30999/m.61138 type:complete len:101 (+) Transcript_30999:210-512(+)